MSHDAEAFPDAADNFPLFRHCEDGPLSQSGRGGQNGGYGPGELEHSKTPLLNSESHKSHSYYSNMGPKVTTNAALKALLTESTKVPCFRREGQQEISCVHDSSQTRIQLHLAQD